MKNKILLIDEDAVTRESLTDVLKTEHYNVFPAGTRQQAMEQHGEERVDLLIFGVDPNENPTSCTMKWLSAIDRRLPVILLAKNSTPGVHLEPTTADAVMGRLFSVPVLLQTIAALLNESLEARDNRVTARRALGVPFVALDNGRVCGVLRARFDTPYFCDRSNYLEPQPTDGSGPPSQP